MFPLKFNNGLTNILDVLDFKKSKKGPDFEPLTDTRYEPPSPGQIRKLVEKLDRCSNCYFLVFDNYWSNEVGIKTIKVCPTCGHRM